MDLDTSSRAADIGKSLSDAIRKLAVADRTEDAASLPINDCFVDCWFKVKNGYRPMQYTTCKAFQRII
jgi:hypothetical protein